MKDFLDREFSPVEMYKLINALIKRKADFEVKEHFCAPVVVFLDGNGKVIGDAVCHSGSYGHEQGLLEIMGLGISVENGCDDDVKGWMTAEEVLNQLDWFASGGVGYAPVA